MKETSLLLILFVMLIVSYAADTSQLVLLASEHFKKNGKDSFLKSKNARVQYHMNTVAHIHAEHRRESSKAIGGNFVENSTVRLLEPSGEDSNHDIGNTAMRYRKRLGKKRTRKVRFFRYGTITLASKQPATLYRNGKRLLDIRRTHGDYKFTREMKIYYRDLLAVESKRTNRRYGVAVDVRLKVKPSMGRRVKYVHYSTQYEADSRMWRGDGILRRKWMAKKNRYCKLPEPTRVRLRRVFKPPKRNAPPLNPKTRYVWVSGRKIRRGKKGIDRAVVPKTAYLLLEVGVRCSRGHQYERARPRTRKIPPRRRGEQHRRRGNDRDGRRRTVPRRPQTPQPRRRARATQPQRKTQISRQPRKTEARRPLHRTEAQSAPRTTTPRKRVDSTMPPSRRTEARTSPQGRTTPRKNTESSKPPRQKSSQRPKPRRSTPLMSFDKSQPESVEKEDVYPPQCKCRAHPSTKRSTCYRMVTHGKRHGRCRRRQCGVSYQCMPDGGSGLLDCIRRVETHAIVLQDKFKGLLRCSYEKLRKPKIYYTVYQ